MTEIKTKKTRTTPPTREAYESLSKYVQSLERRMLIMEGKLNIKAPSLVGSDRKLLKRQQHIIYANHVASVINKHFRCETSDWMQWLRKKEIKEIRWIFCNTLRFSYGMDNYHLISMIIEEAWGFKIHRATIFHAFNKFDDMVDMVDAHSADFMHKYNTIKKLL